MPGALARSSRYSITARLRGLSLIEQEPIEVLFTDLCMPDIDGLAVLRRAIEATCLS